MLYTLAVTRWRKSRPQHLPNRNRADEASEDPLLADGHGATKPRGKPLRGANILLMWLPALCDLSGTTVRILPLFFSFSFCPALPTLPPRLASSFPTTFPTFPTFLAFTQSPFDADRDCRLQSTPLKLNLHPPPSP